MIPYQRLLEAIKEKGFEFRDESKRCKFFKKKGHARRIALRKFDEFSQEYSGYVLAEAGYGRDEIQEFIDRYDRIH